ncbi:hypothetical protein ACC676_00415 [Rhizobium ruizarguesonis]|uniref:hypothetical protein n=1 Tax=Rhizobium leguminosarum TaxID=384 RepID=UPI000FEDEC07|nr:hypothetical protein [Rhizobium leguminosarum]MBY5828564.1 hypothetical protein [Rhizobium leguminosarum]MBY5856301.1 hypothetical protein [Rhizobium leguminosarum]RWY80010.1 hypothetical protein EHI44_30425 [Rhizobium leguminosarum]
MSSVKEYMHELWSQVDVEVSFICPHCRNRTAAWLNVPGGQEEHFAEVPCQFDEDEEGWTVIIRHDGENGWSAELEDAPDVDVTIKVDQTYDDWEEPEPEPGAYAIFLGAMRDWKVNVSELSTVGGAGSKNRLLFVMLYSILEAYLSDAIIGAAMEDVEAQRKMLRLEGLRDKQVSLETILDKPDIVKEMVRTTLQGLSFHNLGPINGMCESAFGKPILPRDKDDRLLVMKSIDKRHDCVHRNGADKNGIAHTDITRQYLEKIGVLFDEIAETLENAIRAQQAAKFFENLDDLDLQRQS